MARPRKQRSVGSTLTAGRLRELLDYDLVTGLFTRRISTGGQIQGAIATHIDRGYCRIQVDGVLHRAHRLAWLYVYSSFPSADLDHIDGDRSNNSISNLRECCDLQNAQNASPRARSDNGHGYRGVSFHSQRGKWQARIMVDGKSKSLGLFDTPGEAHAAYVAAKKELHPFQSDERLTGFPNAPSN